MMNKYGAASIAGSLLIIAGLTACGGEATAKTPVSQDQRVPSPSPQPQPTTQPEQHFSPAVENARDSAQDYLEMQGFSRQGLIDQLSSKYGEGYPRAVAIKAVASLKVNYNQQAVRAAQDYLSMQSFSRAGLTQQLESQYGDQFTHAQAVYGVSRAYGK